ncbi:hypothetical protein AB1K32_04455 [Metabacillus dongyingensis]
MFLSDKWKIDVFLIREDTEGVPADLAGEDAGVFNFLNIPMKYQFFR